MHTKTPLKIELPDELIQQYKEALVGLSDLRLIILLVFNSFEEIMKSFAAWRLSCQVDDLPSFLQNSASMLCEVILIGPAAKDLRSKTQSLRELRNKIAHDFHRDEYDPKLKDFVKKILKKPHLNSEAEKRTAIVEAVFSLVLDIASYIDDMPERGEWPFPLLSLELRVHTK